MAMTTTPTTHMGGSLLRLECWPHRPGASMRTPKRYTRINIPANCF
jgi:hypothetical protein